MQQSPAALRHMRQGLSSTATSRYASAGILYRRPISLIGFVLAFLVAGAVGTVLNACRQDSGHFPSSREKQSIASFVEHVIELELQGRRWDELLGVQPQTQYYPHFVWKPDVEPGWDILTVSESFAVESVQFLETYHWDELLPTGEVVGRDTQGYLVGGIFKDLYRFSRVDYQNVGASRLELFVINDNRGFAITNRLHPPHLSASVALKVLQTAPYRSEGLKGLRDLLSAYSSPLAVRR